MKRACVRARRAWLLDQDRPGGLWGRFRMNRHFRSCPDCRDFAAAASEIIARVRVPELAPPSDRVARELHLQAVAGLARAREAERIETGRSRGRQSLLGSFAGAAAALMLIFTLPEPAVPPGTSAGVSAPASLEDNLDGLQERLDCLRSLMDDINWNSLEGESICTDT